MHDILRGILGLAGLCAIAVACGENRRRASLRQAGIGLLLQVALALLFLKVPGSANAFAVINDGVGALQRASEKGTSFVFGYLGGGPLPFAETQAGASFVFAFRALPIVLLISALTALLTYWRVLPLLVKGMSWLMERTLGIGGAVGLSTAANIFVGMVEAPLFIRPYMSVLTRSELFVVMVGGMAGIAGTVLVLYATVLTGIIPNPAGHLVVASILTAPSAVVIARLMIPETGTPTAGSFIPSPDAVSTMDAITKGTAEGLTLLLNIVAMLIVLVALVALVNGALGLLPDVMGAPISLERMLGAIFAPICWLMGIPWGEAATAGALMGTKTALNEFIAYLQLAQLAPGTLSPKSALIMTYALCGFANFAGLGIMIGGLTVMAPERRVEIAELGLKSLLAGTLATCVTATIVGMITA